MAKRTTNRVQVLNLQQAGQQPFEFVAWRITLAISGEGALTINGCPITALNATVALGGCFDDLGRPVDTIFSGSMDCRTSCVAFLEFRDPDIGSLDT